jgi:hypothetical protein
MYLVWEFTLVINEGDVADSGILGLKRLVTMSDKWQRYEIRTVTNEGMVGTCCSPRRGHLDLGQPMDNAKSSNSITWVHHHQGV